MAGNYFASDTIAAVATSLAGDGGVGVIRLSGPDALGASQELCRGLEKPEPRYLHRVEVVQPATGEVLDDGLAVYFPEGHSFTGEDVVELQLHGGRFLLQSILQVAIGTGRCRLALPGEFSFRAVRNGKLSLAGASAVGQIVQARSMFEVQAARRSLSKSRLKDFDEIAGKLRNLIAQMELSIDFIDQDVEVISQKQLQSEVDALAGRIETLLEQMRAAQRIAKGLSVTLMGSPNAGKSTLFNALLSEERAIVSPEAGTTRDVITEEIRLDPYYLRLADTAGLRATESNIEREGVSRAKGLVEESDLVLLVIDTAAGERQVLSELEKGLRAAAAPVVVLNKWDTIDVAMRSTVLSAVRQKYEGQIVTLSAASGEGVESLLKAVKSSLDAKVGVGVHSFLPTEFQLQMLLECQKSLGQVAELVRATGLTNPELVSSALRSAVKALSDLVGETTPDTVLAKIFSEFCIGK